VRMACVASLDGLTLMLRGIAGFLPKGAMSRSCDGLLFRRVNLPLRRGKEQRKAISPFRVGSPNFIHPRVEGGLFLSAG
jgi:hypothetical protein